MKTAKKLKPLFDRVLLASNDDSQTASGLYIPRGLDDKSNIMRVVDKGQSQNLGNDDIVVVAKYAGTEVSLGSDRYLLVCEHDILGVIK
ncbi:MAG: co-chaperone GroES [Firmicutes bacterium]|nr:co-chaperone GroES [Bacillota bacterium]